MKKIITLLTLVLLLGLNGCKTNTKKNHLTKQFPSPIGSVNDFESIFTENEIKALENIISTYENETTREIAIITIGSIKPYTNINDYATDLSNEWGIGKPIINNGLSILISKKLKNMRVSTGYSTELILTDEFCKTIIDSVFIPDFIEGRYYEGTVKGLNELIAQWH